MSTASKPTDQCQADVSRRDLPRRGRSRFSRLIKRALLLRCPQCGSRGIFAHPWSMHSCCPSCGFRFNREDGYFLGAYAMNLIVAEIVGLGAVLVVLLRSDLSLLWQEVIAVSAAIALPVLFYPFSRTLWMTLDLMAGGERSDDSLRAGEL